MKSRPGERATYEWEDRDNKGKDIQDKHGRSEVADSAVHTLTHINHGSQVNVRGLSGERGTSGVDDKCCLAEQQPVH